VVQRPVARRLEQVGLRRVIDGEGIPAPPQSEHGLLDHVFRGATVAQHAFGHAHQRAVPRAEHGIEVVLAAASSAPWVLWVFGQALPLAG
jgi:hypothetical protein